MLQLVAGDPPEHLFVVGILFLLCQFFIYQVFGYLVLLKMVENP